jgi:prevent-host-death family protein
VTVLIITTTELQNNFGKYLKLSEYEEINITKNGKKVAKLIPYAENVSKGHLIVTEGSSMYKQRKIQVSYQDYLRITEESENRYEYIGGELYLLASPTYPHQKAVGEIFGVFITWFRGKDCEPLVSPFDITLIKDEKEENINVVQPDIIVICDRDKINEDGKYLGTPPLVVEVLSDSTKSKDLIKKLNLYMESGVAEYWVVNTATAEIYIYVFAQRNIQTILTSKKGEKAKSMFFPGLEVDLKQIFA